MCLCTDSIHNNTFVAKFLFFVYSLPPIKTHFSFASYISLPFTFLPNHRQEFYLLVFLLLSFLMPHFCIRFYLNGFKNYQNNSSKLFLLQHAYAFNYSKRNLRALLVLVDFHENINPKLCSLLFFFNF